MSRRELRTGIDIDTGAGRAWEVLTDFASYPQWNPMIRRAAGELRVGSRLQVRFEPEGSKGHTFKPKLTVVEPGRELRWLGWPRLPRLFDSEHYWILEERPDGSTGLVHGTVVYGMLAVLSARALERTRGPFEAMNLALKKRAEGTAG